MNEEEVEVKKYKYLRMRQETQALVQCIGCGASFQMALRDAREISQGGIYCECGCEYPMNIDVNMGW